MLTRGDVPVADEIDWLGEQAEPKRGNAGLKAHTALQIACRKFILNGVRGAYAWTVTTDSGDPRRQSKGHALARHRAGVRSLPDLFAAWPAGSLFHGERGEAWPAGQCWIEVKTGGAVPTARQLQSHALLRDCGQRVLVVRSLEELEAGLRALGAPVVGAVG